MVWLYLNFRRVLCCKETKLVIDWHNYGFTILEANNVKGILQKMAKKYELWFGGMAHGHLTVSKAFREDIMK